MRVGRIPYINCFPVYGAIDRGIVPLAGELVTGVPSALNAQMAQGALDVSVVSAVEYARDSRRYLLLPDLAISCRGPVRSVLLFSTRPAAELGGRRVIVSRSSMTSVLLLELLFDAVWKARPEFVRGDAEMSDLARFDTEEHEARLVIGDAALLLQARDGLPEGGAGERRYPWVYDLGEAWRAWTGLPFVFAVWVAQRTTPVAASLGAHASLIASRDWGLQHLEELSQQAAAQTGVSSAVCREYFRGLDYGLGYEYLAGLTEFFKRLEATGRVPATSLQFPAACGAPLLAFASLARLMAGATLTAVLALRVGAQGPDLPLLLPDGRVVSFTPARLAGMARDTVRVTLHGGASRTYRVLKAYDLLLAAGVRVDSVRGPRSTWVLVATASDGFSTSFTLGELAEDLGPSRVLIATATSTGPLAAAEAPYRLIVPTDKRQGRWARQVTSLAIIDVRPPAGAARPASPLH